MALLLRSLTRGLCLVAALACLSHGAVLHAEEAPPVEEPPVVEPPVKAPVEKEPAERAPVEKAPVEKEPAEKAPVEGASPEGEPAERAPVEGEPAEGEPADRAPNEAEGGKKGADRDDPNAPAALLGALPEAGPDELPPREIDPSVSAGPGGTLLLPAGEAIIGTSAKDLTFLLEGRPESQRALFLFEQPAHKVQLDAFMWDETEISNAQYLLFFQETFAEYDTGSGGLATLEQIAAAVWHISQKEQRMPKYRASYQLYLANKQLIWDAFKKVNKLEGRLKKFPDGKIDEPGTFENMRREPLPRGVKLKYSKRRPPLTWDGITPDPALLGHPVRGMSGIDTEAYAEWAGKHVQTEIEYEYGTRGPNGDPLPWGTAEFPQTAARCNWGAKIIDSHYEATTLPVDSKQAGRSWCGALHTLGNVAEWTSSWFTNYPGNSRKDALLGHWVKVIRGGSAKDLEQIVLRPAFRNWKGGGHAGAPYPKNRFEWTGFRCAAYLEPGRDQLGPITSRIAPRQKVRESWLDIDRYRGAVKRDWVAAGSPAEDGKYVLGRATSVVFVPLKQWLFADGSSVMTKLFEKPNYATKASSLKKRTATRTPPLPLGVLHTDVALEALDVPRPPTEKEATKIARARKRDKYIEPPTKSGGTVKGASFIIAYWHGRVCLCNESMEFLAFLPVVEDVTQVEVKKIPVGDQAEPVFTFDPGLDTLELRYEMPLGGKKPDPKQRVIVTLHFDFEIAMLEAAGGTEWQISKPAAPADDGTEPAAGD